MLVSVTALNVLLGKSEQINKAIQIHSILYVTYRNAVQIKETSQCRNATSQTHTSHKMCFWGILAFIE